VSQELDPQLYQLKMLCYSSGVVQPTLASKAIL